MAPLCRLIGVILMTAWVTGCIPQFDSSTDCETVTDCFKGERCDVIRGCVSIPDTGGVVSDSRGNDSDAADVTDATGMMDVTDATGMMDVTDLPDAMDAPEPPDNGFVASETADMAVPSDSMSQADMGLQDAQSD